LPKVLLATVSILIPILVVDFTAYHILDIKMVGSKPERFFQFSPLLGWDLIPNSSGNWYRYEDGTKYFVEMNGHGFPDTDRKLEKSRPRIALVGDSVTQFWEAELPDRGQFVIEEFLDHRYEVLNFGVRGFGTDQVLILFENHVARFSPDIIIYTFCINDIWDNSNSKFKPYFEIDPESPGGLALTGYPIEFRDTRDWLDTNLRDYSIMFRKYKDFEKQFNNFFGSLFGGQNEPVSPHAPLEDHFMIRPYKLNYDQEDRRREEITLKLLAKLNQAVKDRGMKLLVVEGVYRFAHEEAGRREIERIYEDQFDFDRVTNSFRDFTEENGIAFLSLPQLVQDNGIPFSDLMHPEDDMHFNKDGILFYSQAVVDKLRSLKWVEGPTGPKAQLGDSGEEENQANRWVEAITGQ